MAALLPDAECAACGNRHHFATTQGEVSAGKEYDYDCPETGGQAHLRPHSDGEKRALRPAWSGGADATGRLIEIRRPGRIGSVRRSRSWQNWPSRRQILQHLQGHAATR